MKYFYSIQLIYWNGPGNDIRSQHGVALLQLMVSWLLICGHKNLWNSLSSLQIVLNLNTLPLGRRRAHIFSVMPAYIKFYWGRPFLSVVFGVSRLCGRGFSTRCYNFMSSVTGLMLFNVGKYNDPPNKNISLPKLYKLIL